MVVNNKVWELFLSTPYFLKAAYLLIHVLRAFVREKYSEGLGASQTLS